MKRTLDAVRPASIIRRPDGKRVMLHGLRRPLLRILWADSNSATPVLKGKRGPEDPLSVCAVLPSSLKMRGVRPLPHRHCLHGNGDSVTLPISIPGLGRKVDRGSRCVAREGHLEEKSFVKAVGYSR